MDSTLLPFALLCFTSFFTLTNPLGTMPVFLTMTHGMTDKERQSIVRRATIVSFITIMVFVFAGQFLFKFFGISTDGFRIAGGWACKFVNSDIHKARREKSLSFIILYLLYACRQYLYYTYCTSSMSYT